MEQNPFFKADTRPADEDILHYLRNPMVHYRIYKNQPLDCILSQLSPLTRPRTLYFEIRVNITPALGLVATSGFFASGFPTKMSYVFLISPIRMTCPTSKHYLLER
jgi:hypothetical protein